VLDLIDLTMWFSLLYCTGDRKQELIFIGVKMDRERVVATLDKALLTDGELEAYETFHGVS